MRLTLNSRRAGNTPSETPDIQPQSEYTPRAEADLAPPLAAIPAATPTTANNAEPQKLDNYDDLTDDDIINRITEFKLGLRKDIS